MRSSRTSMVAGVLAVVQVVLAMTGLGSIPLPTGLNVTILSIPSILAGVLAGPIAGAVVGGVFGVTTLAFATSPLFQNPVIAVVPRLLIGPIAALVYRGVRRTNNVLALGLAGVAGAIANTGLVLALAIVLPGPQNASYLAPGAAWEVARTNLPAEVALAALVTIVVGATAAFLANRR